MKHERPRKYIMLTLMAHTFPRTLKLKVRGETYGWLEMAAYEVNPVFNYCNDISIASATRWESDCS